MTKINNIKTIAENSRTLNIDLNIAHSVRNSIITAILTIKSLN